MSPSDPVLGWEKVLDRLPAPYGEALRLWMAGGTDTDIAERLGVAPEAVRTLLEIADAKAAAVLGRRPVIEETQHDRSDNWRKP